MLPKTWRLIALNSSGADANGVEVKADPWNFDNNGEVVYGTELDLLGPVTVGNGNISPGAEQDNSAPTAQYIGIKGQFRFDSSGTDGRVELYIEWKDSVGNYPSDDGGFAVVPENCILLATIGGVAAARSTNFSYE